MAENAGSVARSEMVSPKIESDVAWYDVARWGVEGKGWNDTTRFFDRLPSKAKGAVRERIWNLGSDTAGMCVHFATDATTLRVRFRLLSGNLAMSHMPATGVSGFDLYARHEGKWHWLAVVPTEAQSVDTVLVQGIDPGHREYMLYLPLYNGVNSLEIGVPKEAAFSATPPRKDRLIVFYGTSMTQGGCASRPGTVYTAILGRRLDRPVINLGFTSNGTMDPEVGQLLGELDAAVYVIDCLPNMVAAQVAQRTVPLVNQLRKVHPKTPIVLVEDRTYPDAVLRASQRDRNATSRNALKKAYEELLTQGVANLYYAPGDVLLGGDGEGTVDDAHPSDLGMMRIADALEPILRSAIGERKSGNQAHP